MANFKYVVTDKFGKEKKGTIEATTQENALARLQADGSIVMSIREAASLEDSPWNIQIGSGVKKKDITVFCKQFHSILHAGVSVIDGLRMVEDQTENKNLRRSIHNVLGSVEKGDSLASALTAEGNVFPELLIHMVAAGEATGNLDIAFERITAQFEKDLKLTSMIRSAMIYPIVVLVVAIGVVMILMTTVIPNFVETFDEMGAELPALTKLVMSISDFITGNLLVVVSVLVAIVAFILIGKSTETGKQITSQMSAAI